MEELNLYKKIQLVSNDIKNIEKNKLFEWLDNKNE